MSDDTLPPNRIEVPDARPRGAGLSPWMRDATRALAETLFATDEGVPPAARIDWLCDDLDDLLGRAGPRARNLYRLCVVAVTWLAPLHALKLGAFHGFDYPLRVRALERMERGPLGMAVFGAKALLCFVWYEHPDVARAVGHGGGCLGGAR